MAAPPPAGAPVASTGTRRTPPSRSLLSDRRVLAAAGVGAVALVALVVRSRIGAGTAAAAAPGQAGPLGSFDSSGSDAYNNFSTTLSGFQSQITDLQTQLAAVQNPVGTDRPITELQRRKTPGGPALIPTGEG